MNNEKIKNALKHGYYIAYNFVFIAYFAMVFATIGMYGWFVMYLISGITGTALYWFIVLIFICFAIVVINIAVLEVYKKYIKKRRSKVII